MLRKISLVLLLIGFSFASFAQNKVDSAAAAATLQKLISLCKELERIEKDGRMAQARMVAEQDEEQPARLTQQQKAIYTKAAAYVLAEGGQHAARHFCKPENEAEFRETMLTCKYVGNMIYGYSTTGSYRFVRCQASTGPAGITISLRISVRHLYRKNDYYYQPILFKLMKVDGRWGLLDFEALDK